MDLNVNIGTFVKLAIFYFVINSGGFAVDRWGDVIMEQLSDQDKEIKDNLADEDTLAIPVGPMTRSRTKRLNDTI
ncbi:hypothetical protein F2Q68_00016184 [Brassica cretica]|uniref:Uncharacterized protein n=1 Tax=Brassica cretica TaxID=69181 RepID=A0A8S9H9B0_BRACR|nr:hypothetical protein F2Q68_00016184 [Brassica cretica]